MTRALVIVADDLTGAADTAAVYARAAPVMLRLGTDDAMASGHTAIAIDTDSRHACSAYATECVACAVQTALEQNARIYKKIDSTLRGNTAVEIAATLRALGAARPGHQSGAALLSPAFPGTGRTVRGGIVHVANRPLAHGQGDLAAVLYAHGVRCAPMGLAVVRSHPATCIAAYREMSAAGAEVVIADAETDDDLDAIHRAATTIDPDVLEIGSAGLMGARVADANHRPAPRSAGEYTRPGGSVLTVVGSYSPVARAQREASIRAGARPVVLSAPFDNAQQRQAQSALHARMALGDALLSPDPNNPVDRQRAPAVASALATVARASLCHAPYAARGLIVTGGQTARAVLRALGIDRLWVQGEIEPGVVLSIVPQLADLPLITKAGGFGDPGTLERARRALCRPSDNHCLRARGCQSL